MYQVGHYINGELCFTGAKTQPLYNPALGEVIGQVAFADEMLAAQAVAAASAAFPAWSAMSATQRVQVLFRFKALLEENIDEIAALVTREHGKTLEDARGSVRRGIEVVAHACGAPYQLRGSYSEQVASGLDCYSFRQPVGVCVGISPFNFPVMIPLWAMIPAIACGNTVVLKPSEKDPSAPLRLVELLTEAGLPPGVVNLVNGGQQTVEALIKQPQVEAVTAVGSTAVAQAIYRQATQLNKRVQAFGGAKNHAVVMPDAEMKGTVEQIVNAAYGAAGQRCMALSAVIAVGHVADTLVDKIAQRLDSLRVGPGEQAQTEMGPLVTAAHRQQVLQYIEQGVVEGAALVVDGRDFQLAGYEQGFFLGACLFDQVQPEMQIYQQEIFGPVLVVLRVENFDQAVAMVNAHRYGNGTAIFTQGGQSAREYARRVNVGMVGVNVPIPVPVAYHSFGGWKQSSFGDLRMHGEHSVYFYTREKTVTTRWS